MDTLSISIIVSVISSSIVYALKESLRCLFHNFLVGLMVRGEQLDKGAWINIPDEKIEGLCLGNNFTNVKIDTGDGINHILNEKVFENDLRVIRKKEYIIEKIKKNEYNNWSEETKKLLSLN